MAYCTTVDLSFAGWLAAVNKIKSKSHSFSSEGVEYRMGDAVEHLIPPPRVWMGYCSWEYQIRQADFSLLNLD